MGILARAGFAYDLSKRVLNLEQDEFQKLIKILVPARVGPKSRPGPAVCA